MMAAYDVVVIGGGPGGYSAAIRARQLGRKTALVEEADLGGVCLNWGCIPTKALLKQAEVYQLVRHADEYGIKVGEPEVDWEMVIGRSRDVAERLSKGVAYLMQKNGVDVLQGRGKLTPARKVQVDDGKSVTELDAAQVILATGSRPKSIPGVEFDGTRIISSKEAMVQEERPQALAIIGAGAIGVEFAYFYRAYGSEVLLLEALPQILPREDEEIAAGLAESLSEQGIEVATGAKVVAVNNKKRRVAVRYEVGGEAFAREVDRVLVATGVQGNIEGLGLEAAGVRTRNGMVEVDGRMETSAKGVYAIGDVAGTPQLAHAAVQEGIAAVEFAAGKERPELGQVPNCIYCQPQVASVGMSEKEAREAGRDVKVGRFPFAASGKGQAAGETAGLVKLVFDARYGELLGGAILGAEATELIAELGLALRLEATYEELLLTVHAHPTLSEAVMEAAGQAFGEAINI
ncbi:MAG: dihydrolipoyl dehydrogenase [Gemmatimonadetes bacterium]|nr:dihydrolipoyl dehydrogenase [Gemmatimonadota bacterium]